MSRAVATAWDQLTVLGPAAERVTGAAGLIGELTAEQFDAETINEAAAAMESMETAAAAAQAAGVSADMLIAILSQLR